MSQAPTGHPVPVSSKIVYSVQVIRGIAALLVVMHHAALELMPSGFPHSLHQGAAGVDVFFVISGFVIYLTGRNLSAGEFLARRVARVVPLYWFFTTLKVAFIVGVGSAAVAVSTGWGHVVASYLFTPFYRPDMDPRPLITAAWTLNYEMYFYLIGTLVLALLPQRRFVLGVTVCIAVSTLVGLALQWLPHADPWPAPLLLLNPLCLEFLGGLWLAVLWTRGASSSRLIAVLAVAIGIVWIAVGPVPPMFAWWRPLAWGIPALMVVWGLLSLERSVNFARWRVLILLGEISYALYLSHTATLPLMTKVLGRVSLPLPLALLALMVSSVLIGALVHWLLEKPMTRLASKLLKAHGRPAGVTA